MVVGLTTPTSDWERAGLTESGFDEVSFDAAAQSARDVDSHCFVVIRDGAVASEEYGPTSGPETDHEVYSTTKSLTAAIVGAAQTAGHLDVGDLASTYLDEWADTDSASVTIGQGRRPRSCSIRSLVAATGRVG